MTNTKRYWLAGALIGAQIVLSACSDGSNAVDATVDALPRDVAPDTSPDFGVSPCSTGVMVGKTFGGVMAVCDNTGSEALDQCDAETLCNVAAGWGLCTASQYQDRGDSRGSPVEAWLKACVRDSNDAPTAPTDTLCTCERVIGTEAYDMAWSCTGVPQHKSVRQWHIALIADKLCHRVGINDATTEAYWVTLASYTLRSAAMCCR